MCLLLFATRVFKVIIPYTFSVYLPLLCVVGGDRMARLKNWEASRVWLGPYGNLYTMLTCFCCYIKCATFWSNGLKREKMYTALLKLNKYTISMLLLFLILQSFILVLLFPVCDSHSTWPNVLYHLNFPLQPLNMHHLTEATSDSMPWCSLPLGPPSPTIWVSCWCNGTVGGVLFSS